MANIDLIQVLASLQPGRGFTCPTNTGDLTQDYHVMYADPSDLYGRVPTLEEVLAHATVLEDLAEAPEDQAQAMYQFTQELAQNQTKFAKAAPGMWAIFYALDLPTKKWYASLMSDVETFGRLGDWAMVNDLIRSADIYQGQYEVKDALIAILDGVQ